MELAIERVSLQNSLAMVQGIVERRNTVPILGHVLIEPDGNKIRLSATDLEVGIRTEVACKASAKGSLTLNARKLFEIVREAEGDEVALKSLDNDWVELKCGRARFKMMGLDPRSFPAMPSQSAAKGSVEPARKAVKGELKVTATVLAAMIDKTLFAVSPDEARYNLSGVYIDSPAAGTARMVATDGHRLSMVDREVAGFAMQGGAIIPRKGMAELRKLLDQAGDGEVELALDGSLAWIKRAAIFSNERYHGVKFGLSSSTLTVSSASPEMGEASETIDVEFGGDEFSIGFNASYVQQVLGVIPEGSDAILGVSDEVSPGVITTPADSQFTYVVMPMRL